MLRVDGTDRVDVKSTTGVPGPTSFLFCFLSEARVRRGFVQGHYLLHLLLSSSFPSELFCNAFSSAVQRWRRRIECVFAIRSGEGENSTR